jgi:hypothetical protein
MVFMSMGAPSEGLKYFLNSRGNRIIKKEEEN